jgi:hypothetical protein
MRQLTYERRSEHYLLLQGEKLLKLLSQSIGIGNKAWETTAALLWCGGL